MTISNRSFPWRPLLVLLALAASPNLQAVTLKIATISPEGSVWMQALRDAGETVEARTEGRVKLKFYPGGVQGDDKAVLRKMRVGSLHGGVMTVGILAQAFADLQLYGLPLVFSSTEELEFVRSKMDAELLSGLEDAGYVGFGIAEIGFAYAMSQSKVESVADMQAKKVWVPDGDVGSAKALEAFGIKPIPLTIGDVLGGLQTSLIDTIAAPPVGTITLQWHTRLDYLLDVPLLYTYGLLIVGQRHFNKLSDADQAVVREVMGAATKTVNDRSRIDEAEALTVLKQQGITFLDPQPDALDRFQSMARAANEKLVAEGLVTEAGWQRLQTLRAEYAAQAAGVATVNTE